MISSPVTVMLFLLMMDGLCRFSSRLRRIYFLLYLAMERRVDIMYNLGCSRIIIQSIAGTVGLSKYDLESVCSLCEV